MHHYTIDYTWQLMRELVDLESKKSCGDEKDYDVFEFYPSKLDTNELLYKARFNEHNKVVDLRLGTPCAPLRMLGCLDSKGQRRSSNF